VLFSSPSPPGPFNKTTFCPLIFCLYFSWAYLLASVTPLQRPICLSRSPFSVLHVVLSTSDSHPFPSYCPVSRSVFSCLPQVMQFFLPSPKAPALLDTVSWCIFSYAGLSTSPSLHFFLVCSILYWRLNRPYCPSILSLFAASVDACAHDVSYHWHPGLATLVLSLYFPPFSFRRYVTSPVFVFVFLCSLAPHSPLLPLSPRRPRTRHFTFFRLP